MEIRKINGAVPMKTMKQLILFLILMSVIGTVSASTITTDAATAITTDSAILHATADIDGTSTVFFEYGYRQDHYYQKTSIVTITTDGIVNVSLSHGYPLIPGNTFYYRAVLNNTIFGLQQSFTTASLSTIDGYDFDKYYAEIESDEFDVANTTSTTAKPYEDVMGNVFWGMVFSMIFVVGWIRQGDVTNMSLLGILVSGVMFIEMPVEFLRIGKALLIVSIAGILMSVIYKK